MLKYHVRAYCNDGSEYIFPRSYIQFNEAIYFSKEYLRIRRMNTHSEWFNKISINGIIIYDIKIAANISERKRKSHSGKYIYRDVYNNKHYVLW